MFFYFKNYHFAPKWYFLVATLLLCALFVRLGYWQLARAATNQSLQDTFEKRQHLAPQSLAALTQVADIRYYPVQVTGHYDNQHTLLLDNKFRTHRIGYEVLTPFIPDHGGSAVLINRGWVPASTDRRVLPPIQEIKESQTVVGYIYLVPGKSFTLGNTLEAEEAWPLRLQAVDIPTVQEKLKRPLYPFVLLLSDDQAGGFVRDWQPVTVAPSKNKGYAVQWFSFAAVLMVIFFVLSIRKNHQHQK